MKQLFGILFGAAFILAGCSPQRASNPTPAPDAVELRKSIALNAQYLANACKTSGEFVYNDHLDPSVIYPYSYNELRHAGASYPLGEYSVRYKRDPKIVAAMVRASKFYIKKYVAPVPDRDGKPIPGLLGSWTVPRDEGQTGNRQVKLGGLGLGLISLIETDRAAPGTIPLATLRGLANCILFLQLSDGSFYSKYDAKQGVQNRWDSLYYPGEAALSLAMLYEYDPDPKQKTRWLNAAFKGIGYLARTRQGLKDLPADHWALIATARLWPHYAASDQSTPRNLLLDQGVALCRFLLADGAFDKDSTTPISTRLEGLLAMLEVLPPEQHELKMQIITAANRAIPQLMEVQVKSGELVGGIPHNFNPTTKVSASPAGASDDDANRRGEIRIDYVQHAMTAMMTYDRMRKVIENETKAQLPSVN